MKFITIVSLFTTLIFGNVYYSKIRPIELLDINSNVSGLVLKADENLIGKIMSNKTNPNYRNVIKESISAVEAVAKVLVGDKNAKLGNALSKLESKISIHSALKEGFKKIYGYTSDADGIRHALMVEENLSAEDARYMLVSCSAFVNYLIVKGSKAGLI